MELKICPTCKTMVFADMDTCYGCMYRFGTDPEREEAVRREMEDIAFPEGDPSQNEQDAREAKIAIPWPPPAEADHSRDHIFGGDARALSGSAPQQAPGGEGERFDVFEIPAMTVSVRTASPLPAGITLRINVEPPQIETALREA